jgi:hypothetical protein
MQEFGLFERKRLANCTADDIGGVADAFRLAGLHGSVAIGAIW